MGSNYYGFYSTFTFVPRLLLCSTRLLAEENIYSIESGGISSRLNIIDVDAMAYSKRGGTSNFCGTVFTSKICASRLIQVNEEYCAVEPKTINIYGWRPYTLGINTLIIQV